jgi:iron complex transport system permease protein
MERSIENAHSEVSCLERVSHWKLYITSLMGLFVVTLVLSLNLGFSQISFSNISKILIKHTPILGSFTGFPDISPVEETIIINIRLPRILGGAIAGAALSAAGVVYQGIFRNPMADPYVIGASAGAALGAACVIVFGFGFKLLGVNSISIFAFLGSLIVVLLVYNISRVGTRVPITNLLLSGIAVSIFLSSMVTFMQVIAGEKLHMLMFWLMGSFSYTEWKDVWSVLPLIAIGIGVTYIYTRDLNLLVLGDEEAQHLGVEVEKVKRILIVSGALVTASAVSVGGLIGFIGIIIPHLMRILIGPDHRALLPASVIFGASFLVICDSIARVAMSPAELPVGVITALSGAPFFLYLLRRKREGYIF